MCISNSLPIMLVGIILPPSKTTFLDPSAKDNLFQWVLATPSWWSEVHTPREVPPLPTKNQVGKFMFKFIKLIFLFYIVSVFLI